ncbi:MAG: CDP-alcohol phosphatidyltransferase family protein [candidate division WOR-3 bacterium]
MVWDSLREKGKKLLYPLVKLFSFLPPNLITFIGFLIVFFSSIFIWKGFFRIGGIILIFGSILDAIDGEVARMKEKTSKFGAFLDSTLDRYAEFFIFFSIALGGKSKLLFAFCVVAFLGAYITSYVRARGEGLEIEIKEGLFTRTERIVLLIIGLVLIPEKIIYVIGIIAFGANITAVQRMIIAYERLKKGGS